MKPLDRIRTIRALNATAREKLILYDLQGRANANNQCWPGMETVAKDTGLSRRTVLRTVKALQQAGLLSYRKTGRTHIYMLTLGNAAMRHSVTSDATQCHTKIKGKMLRRKPQSSISQQVKCMACGSYPIATGKLCLKCWRIENPSKRVIAREGTA